MFPLPSMSAWRLVLDFSVFFFRVIFKYTATSKFDSRAACTGAAAFLHGRRILVYRDCTLDEPARVVKPHRKHAQNTTGEVRGEFQRRRVCACCRSRKTHGASALRRVGFTRRDTRVCCRVSSRPQLRSIRMVATRPRVVFGVSCDAGILTCGRTPRLSSLKSVLVVGLGDGLLTVAPAGFFRPNYRHVQLPPVTAAHGRKNPGSQTRRVSTRHEISKGGGSSANLRRDLAFSGGTGGP